MEEAPGLLLSREPCDLRIRLFGPLDARMDDAPLPLLQHREGERLLAFLILQEGAAVPYRPLGEKFWPAEARQKMDGRGTCPSPRQAIYNLRRGLGPEA